MQITAQTPTEASTVFVSSATHNFRIWWNRKDCVWQTDIRSLQTLGNFHYFGQADSLIKSMTNVAITL